MGCIPTSWTRARVVFLPKPAKTSSRDLRSFRPISLTSFVLKTLERIVLYRLEETTFLHHPLHPAQHGFRKNKSTHTALSALVSCIEELKRDILPGIAVFLDIKGAFDNVPHKSLFNILRDPAQGYDPQIATWLVQLLTTWVTSVDNPYTGETTTVRHTRGVPQGAVVSPVLWNAFYDKLIAQLHASTRCTVAYADDLCFVVSEEDMTSTYKAAQAALHQVKEWSRINDITFCPQKSELMVLHGSQEDDIPPPTLYDHPLSKVTQVRYLGVLLEQDLNWMPHITSRLKSGKEILLRCNSVQGKLYGSSINMLLWFLNQVILPHVSHGSFLYHNQLSTPTIFKRFQSLARLAYLQTSPARINTPIAGFQMAFGTMPPTHRIIFENLRTWLRLNNFQPRPHPDCILPPHLQALYDDYSRTGLAYIELLYRLSPINNTIQ
jgi:retron-type reverse transcriptase